MFMPKTLHTRNTLASGSSDGTIRLWDTDTGNSLRTLTGHTGGINSVAFSPDGQVLVSDGGWTLTSNGSWDDVALLLWDVQTGRQFRTLAGHTHASWRYSVVTFSPDGTTLASGSSDGIVLLWEITPFATSNATVSLSPSNVQSPAIGEQLTLSLKIAEGQNVAGYQATVEFDTTALSYVSSANGSYLPSGAFFIPPVAAGNSITLAASSLAGETMGDGTLATLTFEVIAVKASTVSLSDVILTDSTGGSSVPQTENAEITEPPQLPEDINDDGVVNIIDLTLVASNFGKTGENIADINGDGVVNIIDLTLVAAAFGNTADAAPALWNLNPDDMPTRATVDTWLREARQS